MTVNLRRAVEALAKKELKFLQPLYEAITNSLEANATKIDVDIETEEIIGNEPPKVIGFTITDNGDGFTKGNIRSFLELWSDAKMELGCKGSGRITWLNVFERIEIISEIASEGQLVTIPFRIDFEDKDIAKKPVKVDVNKTTIRFSGVTDKYFNQSTNIDLRAMANVEEIVAGIEQSLIIRLFLMKLSKKRFSITVRIGNNQCYINESTIPELSCSTFDIFSDITNESYQFELFYHFIENGKNSKKIYYCANDRTVKEEDDDALKFSCELPGRVSFNMLLCSKYLNDRVNDSRDDFPGLSDKKKANMWCPLLYRDIKSALLKQMHLILLDKFPELEEINKEQEQKAINASPYLATYIKGIDDIVKTEKSLTVKALDAFNRHKQQAKDRFEKLLKDKSIDEGAFSRSVQELSQVAVAELGEYILYRDAIIRALESATVDKNTDEEFVHNIFIPRKSTVSGGNRDYAMTNLWLLDDKFMTFSNAFSDVTIKKIIEEIFYKDALPADEIGMETKKPDVAVFFNKAISRDAMVIEFKSPNATLNEKEKAIGEINRNCLLLKEKIRDVELVWSYIITTIDEQFEVSLRASGYKKRFTNSKNGRIMYFYNDAVGQHAFAIDISAITADAFARNKTFLDILKSVDE